MKRIRQKKPANSMALITTDIFCVYGLQLQAMRVTFEHFRCRSNKNKSNCNTIAHRLQLLVGTMAFVCNRRVWLYAGCSLYISLSDIFFPVDCSSFILFFSFLVPFVSASSISFRFYLNTKPPILHIHFIAIFSNLDLISLLSFILFQWSLVRFLRLFLFHSVYSHSH